MEKNIFHRISVRLSVVVIIYMAVYSSAVDYIFPADQLNFFFSLFFLVMALNFIGRNPAETIREIRMKSIFTDTQNILLYLILSACFSSVLIHSGVTVIRIALIILFSLVFYNLILIVLKKSVILILFWINFYLFMMMLVLSSMPGLYLDTISKYNPFGGLIVHLLI